MTARQYAAPKRLGVNVFTAPGKAVVGERPRPFGEPLGWDPITSTLIYGEYDAVLVDTLATVAEAEALADWVGLHHRNLTTIYVTHGHFDHFFGLSVLPHRPRTDHSDCPPADATADQARRVAVGCLVTRAAAIHRDCQVGRHLCALHRLPDPALSGAGLMIGGNVMVDGSAPEAPRAFTSRPAAHGKPEMSTAAV